MRRRVHRAGLLLDAFAVGVASVAAAFLVSDTWRSVQVLHQDARLSLDALPAAAGAAAVYLLSHLLRAVRLLLLMGPGRLEFGAVFGCHTTVALLTFAMPLKLGEALRATELYRLAEGPRGLFTVWLDRLFDAAVVLVLFGAFALRQSPDIGSPTTMLSLAAFLLASVLAVLVLPGALVALERALVHSASRRSLALLHAATRVRALLAQVPRVDRQTLSLLSIATVSIWGLELLAVFLVLVALPAEGRPLADQAIDALNHAFGVRTEPLTPQVALYRLLCVATLAAMAIAGLRSYLRARLRHALRVVAPRAYRIEPLFRQSRIEMRGRIR